MIIEHDDRRCGTGKTHAAIEVICNQGGKHIFAVERVEVFKERIVQIAGMTPSIATRTISANIDFQFGGQSVCSQIERLAEATPAGADVVVFITHEALKLANFEAFAGLGWTLWIDEVPNILDHQSHRFSLSWQTLDQLYALEPAGTWARVRLRDGAPDVAMLAQDDALQVLRPFHRRVADRRREVLVDIQEWRELSIKGRAVNWHSLWPPYELAYFDRVVMLGNGLQGSTTFQIWQQRFPDVEWQPIPTAGSRPFAPRQVIITYYAENHWASRALFATRQGRRNLNKIAQDIAFRAPDDGHIWMCNDSSSEALARMTGERLRPRKAGSNSYAYANHVTAIYAAKPQPSLRTVYRELEIDPDLHTRWAELETILQFVCRSSIRRPVDNRPIYIRVYDKVQAQYLFDHFRSDPRGHLFPTMVLQNLGFAFDMRDVRPGRKTKVLTLAEQEAKQAAVRARDRERKRRARAKSVGDEHSETG